MKFILIAALALSGCMGVFPETHDKRCVTRQDSTDKYKIIITNGSSQGRYYCNEVYAEGAQKCTEIRSEYVLNREECKSLRDIYFDNVIYGAGTVEVTDLSRSK